MSRNQTLSSKKMTLLSSKASSSSMNTKLLFENTILFVPINLSHFYVNNKKETESSTFKSIPILSFTKRILSPMWAPSSLMDTKLLLTKKSQFRKKSRKSNHFEEPDTFIDEKDDTNIESIVFFSEYETFNK